MLAIPILLLVAVTPAILWHYGKRLLGSQTHPAALFILAWMASALALSAVVPAGYSEGTLALIWVALNFAIFAVIAKFKGTPSKGPEQK